MTIQELMKPFGIDTYTKLASRLGVAPSYGWKIWYGKRPITMSLAKKLHERFGFTYDAIMALSPDTNHKRKRPAE